MPMQNYLDLTIAKLCQFVFPQQCCHCGDDLGSGYHLLCSACWDQMVMLDPKQYCQACFKLERQEDSSLCDHCEREPPLIFRKGAAFSYHGPVRSLIRAMKYGGRRSLGEALGPFLLAQWAHLDFPKPDCIVPIPLSPHKWLQRGFNQSICLSQALSKELDCPIFPLLRRRAGDFSQAGLSRQHRLRLTPASFRYQPSLDLRGRVVLLVDDVLTTGATLDACAEAILREVPCFVYAIALAKT